MPLNTQLFTKDNVIKSVEGGWSWFHLARLADWMKEEIGLTNWKDNMYFLREGQYTFTHDHTITVKETDVWARGGIVDAGYTFSVNAGDTYHAFR